MKTNVVDLSHFDPANDYSAVKTAGVVGVIYKATQGASNVDDTYAVQKEKAKAAGLLWGCYHFGDASDPDAQADHFVSVAKVAPDELFCLDFEDYGMKSMSVPSAKQWISRVEAALNRPGECVFYSGNRVKDQLGNAKDAFLGARRLWLAQYSTTVVLQASWSHYWLWQYTDSGFVPGCPDGIDCNCANDPSTLAVTWSNGSAQNPRPAPPPDEDPNDLIVTVTISAPPGVKVVVSQV